MDDTTINVDPNRLEFVLEILMTNAVRAVRDESVKRIEIASQRKDGRVSIEITNSGEKIPPEIQSNLFREPIAHPAKQDGLGIGLVLAATIIRRYKGDIKLESSSSEQTRFSFWLPTYSPSSNR